MRNRTRSILATMLILVSMFAVCSTASVIGAQKWYVPVWFPDATTYSANITAVGASTPGGELTATIPVNIYIDSNMYTDDSTNNAWA